MIRQAARFTITRLQSFRDHTQWGGNEALESQALQLLEFEALIYSRGLSSEGGLRAVLDLYHDELRHRFPDIGSWPLWRVHQSLATGRSFPQDLYEICLDVRHQLRERYGDLSDES